MNEALKVVNALIIIWGIHLIQGKQPDEMQFYVQNAQKKITKKNQI